MESGRNEWILIVEDDVEIATLLHAILTDEGYNIILASDGEEAVKLYQEHQPKFDLVISDLGLPKLGGVELFQTLNANDSGIKFIASSGYGGQSLVTDLTNMGVRAFVPKPYIPTELFKIIRDTLDK
jgi:two-component system, cell cycle sensor histidine kinase and response regulator CckA